MTKKQPITQYTTVVTLIFAEYQFSFSVDALGYKIEYPTKGN